MVTSPFAPPAFVDLPAGRFAYRAWGRPEHPPLVLIHGITSSSLSWNRVGPALADRFHVVAVDLKGHGDSDRPPTGYRHQDQAAEVAGLIAALDLGRPAVVGHSWGGAVALVLATSTDLVSRLVLEDPALGFARAEPAGTAERRSQFVASVGLDRERAEAFAEASRMPGWTDEDVAARVDAAMKGSPVAVRAVLDQNDPWERRAELAALRCPTLLLRAEPERGGIVGPDVVAAAEANPNVRVVTVPGADHGIHRTQYERFMAEVRAFLAPVATATG
jgi:pimeloyl-ACP methyl ester carboxylesterase